MSRLTFRSFVRWLASPALMHWLFPYLMALVVVGTITQKYIGLYESQQRFFSSLILWAGVVPFPGGRLVIALLTVSLLTKIIFKSPWHWRSTGVLIAHLGALTLLLGGLLTLFFGAEGSMTLQRGERSNGFEDYHQRELVLRQNDRKIATIPFDELHAGQRIASLPFPLTVAQVYRNSTLAQSRLIAAPLEKEDERNTAGVEVTLPQNSSYVLVEEAPKPLEVPVGGAQYTLSLERKIHPMLFSLTLLEAKMQAHPGTMIVSNYASTVELQDKKIHQRATITMNHPLRYKGYTIYQANFDQNVQDTTQTRAVNFTIVRNEGRLFPYVASVVLCLGLLLQLCIKLPKLMRRNANVA